jgi:Acetyltransferase (GNAT) domain
VRKSLLAAADTPSLAARQPSSHARNLTAGQSARATPLQELDGECSATFGPCGREAWYHLLPTFGDANLYQTWSYDGAPSRHGDVVHMILRKRHEIVAAAQARVLRLPGTHRGIAYVRWGPMWRPLGSAHDTDVFRQAVRALRNEFSRRRGLVLRLYPLAYRGLDEALVRILEEEGYRPVEGAMRERTLIIDLDAPLDELRAALDQKWRNCLTRAEKGGLQLVSGTDERLLDQVANLHSEMVRRKGLVAPAKIDHLKMVQRDLPERLKQRTILCGLGSEPCAGAIFSAMGTTGVYLLGATGDVGLKACGSYLIQWTFVRWLKEQGFRHYDLNGIHPEANPGTYHFKRGLAGKRGRGVEFLGRFQVADSTLSDWIVKTGEGLLAGYRRTLTATQSLRSMPRRGT